MRAAGLRVEAPDRRRPGRRVHFVVFVAAFVSSVASLPSSAIRNRHCSVTEMINARVFVANRDAYRLALPSVKAIRRFTVRTVLPEQLRQLEELVLNLRWSWHRETLDLFRSVDPELWETVGHDPVRLLGEVSSDRLAALAADR